MRLHAAPTANHLGVVPSAKRLWPSLLRVAVAALLLPLSGAGCAATQPQASAASKSAKRAMAVHAQADAAADKGDYKTALSLFAKADRMFRAPSASALYNLADCEERLGYTARAYLHFTEFLRVVEAHEPARENYAEARRSAMLQAGPWLRFSGLEGLAEGVSLTIDGAPFVPGTAATRIPVEPGDHIIVIKVEGSPERHQTVTAIPAVQKEVTLDLPSPKRASPDPIRIATYTVGAVAVASLSAGVITGLLTVSTKGDLEDECPNPTQCSKAGMELAQRGPELAAASNATFAIGAGLGAASITMLLLTSPKSKSTAIVPLVLPGGGGLSAGWRF